MAAQERMEMNHATDKKQPNGPWDSALEKLREWDPKWTDACFKMTTNPWTNGILPLKTVELVSLAVAVACTNLNQEGTRRHIRGALDAGATRDEILTVLKMAALLGIHTCSVGAPILLEEARTAGMNATPKDGVVTPAVEKTKKIGQWNTAWQPFYDLDPLWTDQFIAAGIPIYAGGLIPPKLAELLSIAFDVSYTHMYAPGVRRHIIAALKLGATMEEIMEVMKICVVQGVQSLNVGIPILDEELNSRTAGCA